MALTLAVAGVLAGAGVGLGWFGGPPHPVTLLGEGASFVLALMSQWEAGYQPSSHARINYNPAGSGAGVTALTDRVVDFAATDEPLQGAQQSALPGPVVTMPIAGGSLAIVYNLPGASTPLQLTGSALAAIYLGKISSWSDPRLQGLNPSLVLPSQPISTVHRADSAGTTFVLSDYLSQDSADWKSGPGTGIQVSWPSTPSPSEAITGNSALGKYVLRTPYSLGYVDLTDVLSLPGLAYAKMGNPSGSFVLPTLVNSLSAIADRSAGYPFPSPTGDWRNVSMVNAPGAGDYPLAMLAYLFAFQHLDQGFAPSFNRAIVIVDWLNWTVGAGQSFLTGLNYVPLPAALLQEDRSGIASMTFAGQFVPP
ncbi:MAG: phosphate ABC transporter substrate-binding protein PstS [Thermoplasmata archaeon]|nr:phosphate ABC transporter substrate-binding protein PstS [Thermoplasmata archaeon]